MFFIYCYNNCFSNSFHSIQRNEMKRITSTINAIDCWLMSGIHFNWMRMGYNFRYVFFHSSIKVYFIKAAASAILSGNEVKREKRTERNGKGRKNWAASAALPFRNQRKSILFNEWMLLTPAWNELIKMIWDSTEWNWVNWVEMKFISMKRSGL